MPDKKRIVKMGETVIRIKNFCEIKTQELRIRLIDELERLFLYAKDMARTAENREAWMKICGYIAQVINSLADSYDEVRFNKQMHELEQMIEEARRKTEAKRQTPIA